MSQQLGVETSQSQSETQQSTTFLDLLRVQMDGLDRTRRRKRTLKERLGFKQIGCCGPTWGLRLTTSTTTTNTREDDEPFDNRVGSGSNHGPVQLTQGINLAAALAAERNYRTEETVASSSGSLTPLRVSLMRLLEETAERVVEGNETASSSSTVRGGGGNDSMCCVCMGRKKGAALIPCGHTFCRVCSREVWLNRGSCPLCNRPIIEILDIY
ncbi:PREDICTED: death-associated inhibitor of apoptosis 1-like [Camelina sativa]|uniref:Death-associated inhibitor of apoptosis 1-like n=1 Tax=Camelina sativa TaxID=90675 RepID=A0ABM0T7Z9_CAMSA|nr:PREDICTED: death-associated inhibitor of apoptosis 1-like [Camelina sativa]